MFSVDIKDGAPPLKLPFNKTEDPWVVAQAFIHKYVSGCFLDKKRLSVKTGYSLSLVQIKKKICLQVKALRSNKCTKYLLFCF